MSCCCFDLAMVILFQYVVPPFTELLHKQQQHRRRLELIEEYNGGIEDIDDADDVFGTGFSGSMYSNTGTTQHQQYSPQESDGGREGGDGGGESGQRRNNTMLTFDDNALFSLGDDEDEDEDEDGNYGDERGYYNGGDVVASQNDTDDERQSLLNQSSISGASDPILREQDEAYLRTLERDKERERQRQEEEEKQALEEAMEASKKEWREQERQRKADKIAQKDEPDQKEDGVISVLFKLPDGTRIQRRFKDTDTFEDLFDYIDAEADIDPDHYAIATSYPRRKFTFSSQAQEQLKDADLGRQVAFFVEEIFQEN